MAKILVVDDADGVRQSLIISIEDWGYKAAEASSGEQALKMIEEDIYDLVITDLVMDKLNGLELLHHIKNISPATEVLMMSAHGTIPQAVEAIQEGAYDFVVKPFAPDRMKITIEKILDQIKLKQTVQNLKAVLADHYLFDDIVSVSPGMQAVMQQTIQVADWSVPVLIQGESGVGKELVALAVHHCSSRSDQSFIPVNCGAFPDTLLDSELFGHCKGAFTGAMNNKRGLIEEANHGTLFLDEIGEAPPMLQVRLLRFLDNGRFRRVGETVERSSDVRILAATNRDLAKWIKEDKFREDLFYRLSVAVIEIPPLRERREDIYALSQHFLKIYSKRMEKDVMQLSPQAQRVFQDYPWPGNVRELENTIEHAMIVARGNEITVADLNPKFQKHISDTNAQVLGSMVPLENIEKEHILAVLSQTGGNKKKAAEILQISRTTLISKLKTWDVSNNDADTD